jgi:hypothetical protein
MSTLKFVGVGEAETARVAEPLMDPILAVMRVCPVATLRAKPVELIVAAVGDEELQSTLSVTSFISPLA